MGTKETAYTNKLKKALEDKNIYVEKRHADMYTGKGKPDLFCVDLKTNKFCEIEVKTNTGKLRPEQQQWVNDKIRHTWDIIISKPETFESDIEKIIKILK
ncbi:MAG: VRR-NUC domain-containing protein [Christensenellaceae bacterium]|jgi:hypothetical protein|nr:VRR-NUC domain-containing protein [Christensenellaceae bacterium]